MKRLVLCIVTFLLTAGALLQVPTPVEATTATFFVDTFTETSNTYLTSHVSDSGVSWTINIDGEGSEPIVEGGTGVMIPLSVGAWATLTANVTPPSADYDVDGTLKIYDNNARARPGVIGRYDAATDRGYFVFYDCFSGYELRKRNGNGSETTLGTGGSPETVGSSPIITLRFSGNSVTVLRNGSTIIGPIDESANNPIASAGRIGLTWLGQGAGGSSQAFDGLTASEAFVAPDISTPVEATTATFFVDTFTETSNTYLTSHASDSGASWTINIDGEGPEPIVEGDTGVLIPFSVGAWATLTANVTPPSADYDVDGALKIYDNNARTRPGVIGRYDAATDRGYFVFYDCFYGYELRKRNGNGSEETLGTGGSPETVGSSPTITLRFSGNSVTVLRNGSTIIGPIDESANNPIAGAGRIGLTWLGQSAGGSSQAFDGLTASAAFVAPDIASHNFDDGTLGPYTYPWAGLDTPEALQVVNDPTGLLSGKVVQIHYAGTNQDRNRGLALELSGSAKIELGESIFFRGDLVFGSPLSGSSGAQRKLLYWQRDLSTGFPEFWFVLGCFGDVTPNYGLFANMGYVDQNG